MLLLILYSGYIISYPLKYPLVKVDTVELENNLSGLSGLISGITMVFFHICSDERRKIAT